MSAADRAAALRMLREFKAIGDYQPLRTLGEGRDCYIVRNAAAMLTVIAESMEDHSDGIINRHVIRHAIEGVADSLHLHAFVELAKAGAR